MESENTAAQRIKECAGYADLLVAFKGHRVDKSSGAEYYVLLAFLFGMLSGVFVTEDTSDEDMHAFEVSFISAAVSKFGCDTEEAQGMFKDILDQSVDRENTLVFDLVNAGLEGYMQLREGNTKNFYDILRCVYDDVIDKVKL